jgi:hypothetical protein
MRDRIMTRHPELGKSGVNVDRQKYYVIREVILESMRAHDEITFKDLVRDVRRKLEGTFDGSISWYVTTVKLDLEARGIIERIPNSRPQRLRLVER